MLSFYFVAQVSRGCHRSLDFGLVRLPLHNHLSEQHGCAEKNQVILFHTFLTWSETVTCEEHSNVMWLGMLGGDRGRVTSHALASLWEAFGPKHQEEVKPEDAKKKEEEEAEEFARNARREYHDRMHGGSYTPPKSVEPAQSQQPARTTPYPRGGGNFAQLPAGFRGMPTKR